MRSRLLDNMNLQIEDGEFVGIIGHTRFRKINTDPAFKRADKGNAPVHYITMEQDIYR